MMQSLANYQLLVLLLFVVVVIAKGFSHPNGGSPLVSSRVAARKATNSMVLSAKSTTTGQLAEPTYRDANYGNDNIAKYLVDLHDAKATFDFCGGMMFQLVLSDKLYSYLQAEKTNDDDDAGVVIVHDASKMRMHQLQGYEQTSDADNRRIFHGREIRQVPSAAGGMGFVLQLSLANEDDPEGWTTAEINGYDGWGHDSGRVWRKGDRLEEEGFANFRQRFGPASFALHHRFYLHMDAFNRLWLSAEDGCEGTPAASGSQNPVAKLFQGIL